MRSDFYRYVPKDPRRNVEFRRKYLALANEDPKLQQELWIMCSRDLLFWVNTFLWTVNPKEHPACPVRPFITWDCQDEALLAMEEAMGGGGVKPHDIVIEKSREMGGTYITEIPILHRWQFHPGPLAFLLNSSKADLVDKPGDQRTLFWKLDFMLDTQPTWLRPREIVRTEMHLENRELGNSIDGEAAVEDLGRGGRYTAILLDEFASNVNARKVLNATQHAAYCRIFNSTCKGTTGIGAPFAALRKNPHYRKVNLHWSQHPQKRQGLYTWDDERNVPVILDTGYQFPPGYEFQKPLTKEYPWRSPWYDNEVNRATNVLDIIQELDINDLDAGGRWFPEDLVAAAEKLATTPLARGMIVPKAGFWDECDFVPAAGGALELWVPLSNGRPPADRNYICGNDIANGTDGEESSNSVTYLFDEDTGEQVAQYTTRSMEPGDFAEHAIALCYFFTGRDGPALLNWENDGPTGKRFRKAVLRHGYGRLYRKTVDSKGYEKKTQNPGYTVQGDGKSLAFGQLMREVRSGTFLIRSRETVAEMRQYIHRNGQPVHDKALETEDQASKGASHGDRVVAAAMACVARRQKPREKAPAGERRHPEVSHQFYLGRVADRQKFAMRQQRNSRFSWLRK